MRTLPDYDVGDSDFEPIPQGTYFFRVTAAEDATSKNGSEMIKLTLSVTVGDTERLAWDYLVALESMEWKTRHFAYGTGLNEVYDSGNMSSLDCLNVKGECVITHQEYKGKVQHNVQDYVVQGQAEMAPALLVDPRTAAAGDDGDIPF